MLAPGFESWHARLLRAPTDHSRRYYPTERLISKKSRKHYRIPVRSQ